MSKRKVMVLMYRESNLGGPSVAMKKLMDSYLKEKYIFVPYYFTDKLGKIPKLKSLRNLAANIKKIDPEIIYFTGLQLHGFYVALSSALAGYRHKTVMAVRGSSCDAINISKVLYFTFRHFVEPISLRLTEITHTVCTEMAERKMLVDNMHKFGGVIYNMAPISKKDTAPIPRDELGVDQNDIVLIYTGRLVEDKGISFLLKALCGTEERIKLILVGDGSQRTLYENMCIELGLKERVIFTGSQNSVFPFLATSDIYVFPTLHENLSNALLEAGTMGLPIIATDVGGNPEVVQDGVEGILVPARDAEALHRALTELSSDEEKRNRMSKAVVNKMERVFAPEIIVNRIDELFARIQ